VLLRSLLRRMTPDVAVFVAAVAFGVVHAIGDPSVGTLIALPAIIALGVVSGYQAVKTGDLARSVMLHVGFNALSAILLFTT
jgi:membrane protease YdiL (CAAX protease family)